MTERRKITLNPKTRNGGKSPHILKRGTAENHPKSENEEWRKITPNPKTRNGGKSPKILKRGKQK